MRNILLRAFAFLVAFAILTPIEFANAQIHLDTSIRTVKWDSLLAHDSEHFEFDSEASDFDRHQYDMVLDSEQAGGFF